ncbi:hypothetical protein Mgra_00001579 [Meloidogyne graminicola]|uniref:Uncharacterized protein n=1 Tax=Meloidogyne graminicola TaxID=189291 RepID=A0A8T0A0J6_9BILA|nr:hypothetical protein Mgra_00001579 [Meloidogyne graminicola]
MVISGPPQSPRTGLALTDLQSTSGSSIDLNNLNGNNNNNGINNNNINGVSGGLISGLTIASNGSGNWSTRGVGGIGAGLSCSSVSQSSFQLMSGGLFGGDISLQIGGINGNNSSSSNGGGIGGFGNFGQINGGINGNVSGGGGLFNNCGCSSSDYGLFKK